MHPIDDDPEEMTEPPEGWGAFVPDFVKKAAIAGLGALFMTEEGLRSLAGQLKMPKEMLAFILAQADRTKGEIGRVVSEEVRRFLQSETLRDEFLKLLTGMTVEIKAEVKLVPSGKDDPKAKLTVSEVTARRGRKSSAKKD